MNAPITPWWQTLKIRSEIVRSSGAIDDVQMSLFQAVHGAVGDRPPYAEADYYGEITHPSPQFIDLVAKVAVRLGGGAAYTAAPALWRLDQAMGGGKSHGLIGLYHLAANSAAFRQTDVGKRALALAEQIASNNLSADFSDTHVVVLACDNMTAGKGVVEYDGPAETLHERFLWRLFNEDMALYKRYRPHYADKSKLVEALTAVGRPVLILVDEIMDYVRQLSDRALHDLAVKDMAFLRALLDSVNDVPHVAMVVVMIASEKDTMDLDAEGHSRRAELYQLLIRNGKLATINDNTDFSAILRRRLFESSPPAEVLAATAAAFQRHMTGPWKDKVFEILGVPWTKEWADAITRSYPFHPQLVHYAEQEWSKLAGFQRVRSTIRIFAATVYTLTQRAKRGEWVPLLIGPGDVPLSDLTVREAIIGSGLITDVRTQANYRQLASTDIVGTDDHRGAARTLDRNRSQVPYARTNPRAAERAATCLFLTSIVGSRGGGRQGSSEPELESATFVPDASYGYADSSGIISELKDIDGGGLASVEVMPGRGGQPPRLFMSTRQTLNMLVRAARSAIGDDERDDEIARTAERLATTGPFKTKLFVQANKNLAMRDILATAGIDDARATRLIILDARQFSLFNGVDRETRSAIRAVMGIGNDPVPVRWASSAIFAVANTRGRSLARGAAITYLAWDRVLDMVDVKADKELAEKAEGGKAEARHNLNTAVRRSYQHIVYLDVGNEQEPRIDTTITFEHPNQSSLDGTTVWKALVEAQKAFDIGQFTAKALLHNLRPDDYDRPLDEVRDSFWSAPRMPLLPGGDRDLQHAIYEAVTQGALRLVGWDGTDRAVASPGEIGIGQSSLRLAKPVPVDPSGGEGIVTSTPTGEGASLRTAMGTSPAIAAGSSGAAGITSRSEQSLTKEQELAFSLMGVSLSDDTTRDALYRLLQAIANRVDEREASFAQLQLRIRVASNVSEDLAQLVRALGGVPSVRDV